MILILATITINVSFAASRVPPGTVKVKYNGSVIYVDKNPINEFNYSEFLWHLKNEKNFTEEQLFKFLPDTVKYRSYSDFMFRDGVLLSDRTDPVYLSDYLKNEYGNFRTETVKKNLKARAGEVYDFEYVALPYDEYVKICAQNHKLKILPDEQNYTRYVVTSIKTSTQTR